MKHVFLTSCLLLCAAAASAQNRYNSAPNKFNYEHYNNIKPIEGSEYVYATAEHVGKFSSGSDFLMIINTRTGETRKVDFPPDADIQNITHLRYDSIGINKLMVIGKTVDLNDKSGINYRDPRQIIILSIDGKDKTIITEDGYYVRYWYVSPVYGTITVLGYYDDNNNGRLDKSDKSETLVYDLKKMKLLSKT